MIYDLKAVISCVRKALMRRGRTVHDADDLVQEAWVRLAFYERERTVAEPEAFLMRVALNLSIDSHRTQAKHGEQVTLDNVVLIDAAPSAEAALLARERATRLTACVGELEPRTRDIFLAHRLEGLSYTEIARRHKLSVSSVEKHIAKALSQLTEGMTGW